MDYSELVAAAQPDALREALAANADEIAQAAGAHHGADLASVREATYKGHQIVIRTTYEITVDGRPFDVHVTVDNNGRVHYHGLPTRDFASVTALVEKAIDIFGTDQFTGETDVHPPDHPEHHHDDRHHG